MACIFAEGGTEVKTRRRYMSLAERLEAGIRRDPSGCLGLGWCESVFRVRVWRIAVERNWLRAALGVGIAGIIMSCASVFEDDGKPPIYEPRSVSAAQLPVETEIAACHQSRRSGRVRIEATNTSDRTGIISVTAEVRIRTEDRPEPHWMRTTGFNQRVAPGATASTEAGTLSGGGLGPVHVTEVLGCRLTWAIIDYPGERPMRARLSESAGPD